jgi:hypothetical protein
VSTVAYVCRNKLKVRHCISVLLIKAWGGVGTRAARGGVSEGPSQRFERAFSARRAIRLRGGGTQAHITPFPQAKITIETPLRALQHIWH